MQDDLVPLLHPSVYKYYKPLRLPPATVCYLRRIAPAPEHWLPVLRLSVQTTGAALLKYATKHKYGTGTAMRWVGVQRAHMQQREPRFFATSPLLGPVPELQILDNAAVAGPDGVLAWNNGLPLGMVHEKQEPGSHWHVERYHAHDLLFMHALKQGSCRDETCVKSFTV